MRRKKRENRAQIDVSIFYDRSLKINLNDKILSFPSPTFIYESAVTYFLISAFSSQQALVSLLTARYTLKLCDLKKCVVRARSLKHVYHIYFTTVLSLRKEWEYAHHMFLLSLVFDLS